MYSTTIYKYLVKLAQSCILFYLYINHFSQIIPGHYCKLYYTFIFNFSFKVRIIVSDVDKECWEEEINKLSIKVIKSWLPLTICGFFRNELRMIRTILLAFWTSTYSSGRLNPVIILTDTCAITMPILKLFGNFKIIYFQYFFQLESLPNQRHLLLIQPTWIQHWSMKFADEVIVQNCSSARMFTNAFKNMKVPKVLYPCVDIGKILLMVVLIS